MKAKAVKAWALAKGDTIQLYGMNLAVFPKRKYAKYCAPSDLRIARVEIRELKARRVK